LIESLTPWWTHLLAILFCLIGSAFFSGCETALTALGEAKVHQIIEQRGKRARILELWLKYPNHVLTTLLIGNNLVNILASALATAVASGIFRSSGLGIAVGVMTLLLLVFGEITPKTFAKHNAERIALVAIHLVRFCYILFFPVVILLVWFTQTVVRLTGGKLAPPDTAVTEQDIEFMIGLGRREGVLQKDEERMLHSVLEFSDTITREVMVPRTNITAVPVDIDRETLIRTVIEAGFSRLPVYEDSLDSIIGLLHAKDLLRDLNGSCDQPLCLRQLLRPVFYVPESMKISVLLKEFQRRKTHLAVVVDEYGGTAGIVAMEDIIEEIVGEIHDEYDIEEKKLRQLGDGHYLADARISVDELGEQLGIEFPEDDGYETLGGFLIHLRGSLPAPGDRLRWNDLLFIVQEADEKRLIKVEVQLRNNVTDPPAESEAVAELDHEQSAAAAGSETEEETEDDTPEDGPKRRAASASPPRLREWLAGSLLGEPGD